MNEVDQLRLDQVLHNLRFFKTRSMAQDYISKGRVRINGEKTSKPSRHVRLGDQLVFALNDNIHAIKIKGLVDRRVGAPIAREMYEIIEP